MFYYLEGAVAQILHNAAVIDVGGAGYACIASVNTLSKLQSGKKTRLYTYCYIKEDAFDIYGFHDLSEKRCFELLIGVSGVGPKAALSILSHNTPESLALAIIDGDESALTAVSGIGKKTAGRIFLELQDKITKESSMPAIAAAVASGTASPGVKQHDAVAALAVLGYTPSEIAAAMRGIDLTTMSVEDIVRKVLSGSLK